MGFHSMMNHLIEFSKTRKRVYGKYKKFLNNENIELLNNIEKTYINKSNFYLSKRFIKNAYLSRVNRKYTNMRVLNLDTRFL